MPPGCTLLRAVKFEFNTELVNDNSLDALLSREVSATSDGELARVGTWGVRVASESNGKTRYISATTCEIAVDPPEPGTMSPTNDAELMMVWEPRTKSS